jgi:hypothetical protein
MQIMKIVEQMMAEGATEQEIEEFLKQIGMTLEELEMGRRNVRNGRRRTWFYYLNNILFSNGIL